MNLASIKENQELSIFHIKKLQQNMKNKKLFNMFQQREVQQIINYAVVYQIDIFLKYFKRNTQNMCYVDRYYQRVEQYLVEKQMVHQQVQKVQQVVQQAVYQQPVYEQSVQYDQKPVTYVQPLVASRVVPQGFAPQYVQPYGQQFHNSQNPNNNNGLHQYCSTMKSYSQNEIFQCQYYVLIQPQLIIIILSTILKILSNIVYQVVLKQLIFTTLFSWQIVIPSRIGFQLKKVDVKCDQLIVNQNGKWTVQQSNQQLQLSLFQQKSLENEKKSQADQSEYNNKLDDTTMVSPKNNLKFQTNLIEMIRNQSKKVNATIFVSEVISKSPTIKKTIY